MVTARPKNCWDTLDKGLQLKVLAAVPTSKSKLALRFVSKSWAALLDSPGAHDDKSDGLVLTDSGVLPLKYLKHLKGLNVCFDEFTSTLEPQLVASVGAATRLEYLRVDLTDNDGLAALPYLAKLTRLEVLSTKYTSSECLAPLRPGLLPSLRYLRLQCDIEVVDSICKYLTGFTKLNDLEVELVKAEDNDLSKLDGLKCPEKCKLSLALQNIRSNLSGVQVPAVLSGMVDILLHTYFRAIDLQFLSTCNKLKSIHICMTCDASLEITGSEFLLENVKKLIVTCRMLPSIKPGAVSSIVPDSQNEASWDHSDVGATWVYNLSERGA